MLRQSRIGFTLIELLVVIAMIAILAASLMPALSSATDRARVTQCRSNLTHIAIALKMYYNDQGAYPPELRTLYDAGFITDDTMLVCTKTGRTYSYSRPDAETATDEIICACVSPNAPDGRRPHSFRHSFVALQKGGKLVEIGR